MVGISIVTISFNQAAFLERNLASVRAQDYEDWEQVVVDAGSEDGSRELVKRAAESDPRVIPVFEQDDGPADGLNHGLDRIRAPLFLYLNADDELAPGALAEVVSAHDRWREFDILIGNGWIIDAEGRPLRFVRSDRYSPTRYAFSVATVLQQSTTFKARVLERGVRFNPANPVSWDSEFLLDAANIDSRIRNIDAVIGYFRLYAESITGSGRLRDEHQTHSLRLRRSVVGPFPGALLNAASLPPRAVRFAFDRTSLAVRRPQFPGLAR